MQDPPATSFAHFRSGWTYLGGAQDSATCPKALVGVTPCMILHSWRGLECSQMSECLCMSTKPGQRPKQQTSIVCSVTEAENSPMSLTFLPLASTPELGLGLPLPSTTVTFLKSRWDKKFKPPLYLTLKLPISEPRRTLYRQDPEH